MTIENDDPSSEEPQKKVVNPFTYLMAPKQKKVLQDTMACNQKTEEVVEPTAEVANEIIPVKRRRVSLERAVIKISLNSQTQPNEVHPFFLPRVRRTSFEKNNASEATDATSSEPGSAQMHPFFQKQTRKRNGVGKSGNSVKPADSKTKKDVIPEDISAEERLMAKQQQLIIERAESKNLLTALYSHREPSANISVHNFFAARKSSQCETITSMKQHEPNRVTGVRPSLRKNQVVASLPNSMNIDVGRSFVRNDEKQVNIIKRRAIAAFVDLPKYNYPMVDRAPFSHIDSKPNVSLVDREICKRELFLKRFPENESLLKYPLFKKLLLAANNKNNYYPLHNGLIHIEKASDWIFHEEDRPKVQQMIEWLDRFRIKEEKDHVDNNRKSSHSFDSSSSYDSDSSLEETDDSDFEPVRGRQKRKTNELRDYCYVLQSEQRSLMTLIVEAVASEKNFDIFEVHPGMSRNSTDILEKIGECGRSHMLQRQAHSSSIELKKMSRQSLVLLQDVDILFAQDVGFWKSVTKILDRTRRPVIMTLSDGSLCDDYMSMMPYNRFHHLYIQPPAADKAVPFLYLYCLNIGFDIDPAYLAQFFTRLNHDISKCLRELQISSLNDKPEVHLSTLLNPFLATDEVGIRNIIVNPSDDLEKLDIVFEMYSATDTFTKMHEVLSHNEPWLEGAVAPEDPYTTYYKDEYRPMLSILNIHLFSNRAIDLSMNIARSISDLSSRLMMNSFASVTVPWLQVGDEVELRKCQTYFYTTFKSLACDILEIRDINSSSVYSSTASCLCSIIRSFKTVQKELNNSKECLELGLRRSRRIRNDIDRYPTTYFRYMSMEGEEQLMKLLSYSSSHEYELS